ncbi:unnamed protein product [Discosporangium mesarthrocarpum]
MRDYYNVLRVARNATQSEIKTAYRQIALAVHPDVNKDKDTSEDFKNASEAYGVLADRQTRMEYDRSLGIRRVDPPRTHWGPTGSRPGQRGDRGANQGAETSGAGGATTQGEAAWKAWHYGVDAVAEPAIKQSGSWIDLEGNSHQEFFQRQARKEKAVWGMGRGHRFSTNMEKQNLGERVRLRREARLERQRARAAGEGQGKEDAQEGTCTVS